MVLTILWKSLELQEGKINECWKHSLKNNFSGNLEDKDAERDVDSRDLAFEVLCVNKDLSITGKG